MYFDVDGYNMGAIVFNEGWWYEPNDNDEYVMSGESLLFLGEVVMALNSFEVMNNVFVLCLHSDTLEPYESYPQTELLCAFTSRPSKADIYRALRKRLPNTSGIAQWSFGKENCWSNTLCLEPSEGDYYGSVFRFEVGEVAYDK